MNLKKIGLGILIIASGFCANGQGIQFQTNKSWNEIKEQAKSTHKYIFLDAFATWCVPCKEMDQNVFTRKEIGDYVNKNFIAIRIQMDSTKNNAYLGKTWSVDTHLISESYQILGYPTILFINPSGELVLKSFGSKSADELLSICIDALDSTKQLYPNLKKFENQPTNINLGKVIAREAFKVGENELSQRVANDIIDRMSLSDFKDVDNIKFLSEFTWRTTDPGFKKILLITPTLENKPVGESAVLSLKRAISADVRPIILNRSLKTDIQSLKKNLIKKYGKYGELVGFEEAAVFYYVRKNITGFVQEKNNILKKYPQALSDYTLSNDNWFIFQYGTYRRDLLQALIWSKNILAKDPSNPYVTDTYANLYYKMGNIKKALFWEAKALEIIKTANNENAEITTTYNKMLKGQITWPTVK